MTTKKKRSVSPTLPTCERILRSARKLFQQRGYYAIGTAEILKAANAPKGSMYHHFPEGKEQIAIEAVNAIRQDLVSLLETLAAKGLSVAEIVRQLGRGMALWLKNSQWREGTMIASTTVGSVPDLPNLHAATKSALDEWRSHLSAALRREGWSKAQARAMTQQLLLDSKVQRFSRGSIRASGRYSTWSRRSRA